MISLSPTNVIGSTVARSLSADNATKWSEIILTTLNNQNQSLKYELIALEYHGDGGYIDYGMHFRHIYW